MSKEPTGDGSVIVDTLAEGDLLFSAAHGCATSGARIAMLLAMHAFDPKQEFAAMHHARNLLLLGVQQLTAVIERWPKGGNDVPLTKGVRVSTAGDMVGDLNQ